MTLPNKSGYVINQHRVAERPSIDVQDQNNGALSEDVPETTNMVVETSERRNGEWSVSREFVTARVHNITVRREPAEDESNPGHMSEEPEQSERPRRLSR